MGDASSAAVPLVLGVVVLACLGALLFEEEPQEEFGQPFTTSARGHLGREVRTTPPLPVDAETRTTATPLVAVEEPVVSEEVVQVTPLEEKWAGSPICFVEGYAPTRASLLHWMGLSSYWRDVRDSLQDGWWTDETEMAWARVQGHRALDKWVSQFRDRVVDDGDLTLDLLIELDPMRPFIDIEAGDDEMLWRDIGAYVGEVYKLVQEEGLSRTRQRDIGTLRETLRERLVELRRPAFEGLEETLTGRSN